MGGKVRNPDKQILLHGSHALLPLASRTAAAVQHAHHSCGQVGLVKRF